jgi:prolyl-tRNA editing enzyme YbaK/EbsC (Cys-tRNA(Pro) deacylase)
LSPFPEPVERVASFLRSAAVEATIEEFAAGTPTAEEAARAAGCKLEQIVKTLVFVCDGEYVLVLVPGDRRADERKVAAEMDARDVRVARAKEVVDATGFEPGAVAPFPRPHGDARAFRPPASRGRPSGRSRRAQLVFERCRPPRRSG